MQKEKLLKIRVSGNLSEIEALAQTVAEALEWEVINKSRVYPCRPPNQTEGRIYLTFRRT